MRYYENYNNTMRIDWIILSAILLDFFAAQKYFAYSYGRSLYELHDSLREADEKSVIALPKPSWQMLMTYVTQTEEGRAVQGGEIRPSLIMRMASEEYRGEWRAEAAGGCTTEGGVASTQAYVHEARLVCICGRRGVQSARASRPHQPALPATVRHDEHTRQGETRRWRQAEQERPDMPAQHAEVRQRCEKVDHRPTLAEPQQVTPAAFGLHSTRRWQLKEERQQRARLSRGVDRRRVGRSLVTASRRRHLPPSPPLELLLRHLLNSRPPHLLRRRSRGRRPALTLTY